MWIKLTDKEGPVAVEMETGSRFRGNPNDAEGGAWLIFPNGHTLIVTESFEALAKAVGCLRFSGEAKRHKKLASV